MLGDWHFKNSNESLLVDGINIQKDPQKAIEFYSIGANTYRNARAMFSLAWVHQFIDEKKVVFFFLKKKRKMEWSLNFF